VKLDQETLRDLVDERLPRAQVRAIQSGFKDPDRFDKYIAILQEKVPWDERIVLPFGEHLYVVLKNGNVEPSAKATGARRAGPSAEATGARRAGPSAKATDARRASGASYSIKCECGHNFCDYRENWKLEALIHVRDSEEELLEIYPEKMHGDPRWSTLREYFCPGCKTLLEVEAVPPGYPVIHDFVPDLDGFYEEWLGRALPT
jgi:acetone carboxylase, gamma subunit